MSIAERQDPAATGLNSGLSGVFGYAVRRLHAAFVAAWPKHFRPLGVDVTPMQGGALMLLQENPGISQNALARLLEVEPPTVTQLLSPLLKAAYVQRNNAPRDRRAIALHLTKSGRALTNLIRRELPRHEANVLAALSNEESAQLLRLMHKAIATGNPSGTT